jgi:hypothetical protein
MEPEHTSGTQSGESSSSFQPAQRGWGSSQKSKQPMSSSLPISAAGTGDFGSGKRSKVQIAHQNVFVGKLAKG